MVEAVWLDNAIKTFPHNIAKALKRHGEYAKLQGDACLHMSAIPMDKPKFIREFANYGLGIHPWVATNAYLGDKDADYNAAY